MTSTSVEFDDVWVTGDFLLENNRFSFLGLEGLTLGGTFRFKGNRGIARDDHAAHFWGDILAIDALEIDLDGV